MEFKQLFIQLNEESKFNTVKITRQLSTEEDRIERQRNGLNAAIKMEFGKTSPIFFENLNNLYQSTEIPLFSNSMVLLIHKKWLINKSIFDVLKFLFVEINKSKRLQNKEYFEKIIHYIELQTNINIEHIKYKIWLTNKIILKIYTGSHFDELEKFISAIWRNFPVLSEMYVPDVFVPKLVDSYFKPIWFAFSIFKKQKASNEIYFVFFNDFFTKLLEPELADEDFLEVLEVIFKKNKIEVVFGLSYKDFKQLFDIFKINKQLFDRLPDLSKTQIQYHYKDRKIQENHLFKLVYGLFTDFGISYFFVTHFLNGSLDKSEGKWFRDVLKGVNLVYSKNLPCTITKKVAHFFNTMPEDLKNNSYDIDFSYPKSMYGIVGNLYSLTQCLIYCAIYHEVRNIAYTSEVLRNIRRNDNLDFWIVTLCKLYHKGLLVADMSQVVDYIEFRVFRCRREIDFNTKKLSNLLAEVVTWHESLIGSGKIDFKKTFSLPKSKIDTYKTEYKDKQYQIIQLLTNRALREEGATLSHCVGSYTYNCLYRHSFIFSLQLELENEVFEPLITIEVNANSVRQMSGKRNRVGSQEEKNIIRNWALKNNVKFL